MNRTTSSRIQSQALYEYGHTSFISCKADSRFLYCLYVPPYLQHEPEKKLDLVVVVHGTKRQVESYRNAFSEFGKWNGCIVLTPLFPVGVARDDYRDGYKYLIEGDIRYDKVLLAMIDEIEVRYRQKFKRFSIFGYSGGGQFVNRFYLLHPERLWGASIGAPGKVTLIDPDKDWWVGTGNIEKLFAKRFDMAEVAKVPVQMLVGSQDTESWEITVHEGDPQWMVGANDTGVTRQDRIKTLKTSFEAAGVNVQLDVISGVAHDGLRCVDVAQDFLAKQLADWRSRSDS